MPNAQKLAAEARASWGLDHSPNPAEVGGWLEREFGARPFAVSDEMWANLEPDPAHLVTRSLFFGAWLIEGPVVRDRLASASDLVHFSADDPEEFEEMVAALAPEVAEVARLQQRMELVELVLVLIEHAEGDPGRVGNFFVQGPGQRLTEMLWAVTGVLPASEGAAESDLYRRACALRSHT